MMIINAFLNVKINIGAIGDNYDEMVLLRRDYGKYLKDGGWFGCWRENDCKRSSPQISHICGDNYDDCVCDICQHCGERTYDIYEGSLCYDCYEEYKINIMEYLQAKGDKVYDY